MVGHLRWRVRATAAAYVGGVLVDPKVEVDMHVEGNREDWSTRLQEAGLQESLHLQVPLPAAESSKEAKQASCHLRNGIAAQARGGAKGHEDAIADCRKALEALKLSGVFGELPQDLHEAIQKNARSRTMRERADLVHAAVTLFCHAAHHASDEEFDRLDSSLALVATASLIRLSAGRRQNT